MKKWYAVNTKPHQESRADENLQKLGYQTYLPVFTKSVRHARKIMTKKQVLFPGYLFVSFDVENKCWVNINNTFGVKLIIGNQTPQAIDKKFMQELKNNLEEGSLITSSEFKEGDEVKVISGPFTDVIAIIKNLMPKDRVEVLLSILGGNITALILKSAIMPAR